MHNRCCGGRAWCVQVSSARVLPPAQKPTKSTFDGHLSGHLRNHLCGYDVATDFVCWICCDGSHHIAKPLSGLQHYQHDHLQHAGLSGVRFSHSNDVLRSGKGVCLGDWSETELICTQSIHRAPFPRGMPPRRWFSSWASRRGRCFSNAQSAAVSNLNVLIIARFANGASGRWTTIVRGLTIVSEKIIRNISSCLR